MKQVRLVLVVALAALIWSAAAQAATTRVTPASGPRGSKATLVGTGFRAGKAVTVVLGRTQVATARTTRFGRFAVRLTVPRGAALGARRLLARDGRRAVAYSFAVTRRAAAKSSSMTAGS